MKLKSIAFLSFMVSLTISGNAFSQNKMNDIFAVEIIERKNNLVGDTDDYYYSINYLYSNVTSDDDDTFWGGVKKLFVEKDSEIVFQVNQEVKNGQHTTAKASKVLSIFDRRMTLVGSNVSYQERIVSPQRYQNSDSIKLQASLTEITRDRASILRLVLGEVSEIPLVTSFAKGSITLASNIIDSISGVSSDSAEKRKVASYNIQGTDELAKVE